MKKVFVCAGMGFAKNNNINSEAILLGEKLAKSDCIYSQGGSNQGLMGLTLNSFLKYSKNVEFYIPKKYYENDSPKLIELVGETNFNATKTNGETDRLKKIISCDEIIVLPGGTGTIEELLFCNETSRALEHESKITLVNIDGYFNGLLSQLKTNMEENFTKPSAIKFNVVDSVKEIDFGIDLSKVF